MSAYIKAPAAFTIDKTPLTKLVIASLNLVLSFANFWNQISFLQSIEIFESKLDKASGRFVWALCKDL